MTPELIKDAERLYAVGASAHYVAATLKLSYEDAIKAQHDYAETLRQQAGDHRLLLRTAFRNNITNALSVLVKFSQGKEVGYRDEDLTDSLSIQRAKIRVDCAKAVAAMGQRFIDDDVVVMHTEKPTEMQAGRTVFDYETRIDDKGGIVLDAIPRPIDVEVIE